jgi:hypothetical protein
MIEEYLALAERIQQELDDLSRIANRAERAMKAARQRPQDQDLYLDSAVLNLHDYYAGLERIFQQIGTTVDGHIPKGSTWHRDLLQQMQTEINNVRPPVLSKEAGQLLDEFLRFRHVVRNIYAFNFDAERVQRLVEQMQPTLKRVRLELLTFISFLKHVGKS